MINNLECYIVELLQNNVIYNNKPVPVISEFMEDPARPVITLDLGAGVTTDRIHHEIKETETIYYYRTAVININLWTDSVQQRNAIIKEVMKCFYDESNFKYIFCTKFDKNNNNCMTVNNICPAVNGSSARTLKGQCPDPILYEYEKLSDKYNIIHGGLDIKPPYYLTDTSSHPPIYRAVFRADAEYIEKVEINSHRNEDIQNDIRII